MQDSLKRLILKLFDIGAIEFGSFKFKHHEKNPKAPIAPMKINLRTPDHPLNPGKLTPEIVFEIAVLFCETTELENIQFDYIAGIPRAGEPFARVMAKIMDKPLLTVEKIEKNKKRKIGGILSSLPIEPGKSVLLLDDVITKGFSKQEAIHVFETAGLKIAAILLYADREEGGMKHYTGLGYRILAVSTITEILNLGLLETKMSPLQHQRCIEYLELSRADKGGMIR